MPQVREIAPDIYRICVLYKEINLQFCHFLVNDDEPLLFHASLRSMFPSTEDHGRDARFKLQRRRGGSLTRTSGVMRRWTKRRSDLRRCPKGQPASAQMSARIVLLVSAVVRWRGPFTDANAVLASVSTHEPDAARILLCRRQRLSFLEDALSAEVPA